MSVLILLQMILPNAISFDIVSDRTERGGESELVLTDLPTGLNFKGQVGAIQGTTGPVGFALARVPVTLDSSTSGATLAIESTKPVVISFVVGVSDSLNPSHGAGKMTYSTSAPLKVGKNEVQFLWTQMEAKVRGRPVLNAPKFQPKWAETFAIQVARSQQVIEAPVGAPGAVPFDFTILK